MVGRRDVGDLASHLARNWHIGGGARDALRKRPCATFGAPYSMSSRGQHSGRVLLVQNTREGWESITEADGIPCLIGKYVHQDGGEYLPYYEVDSPYLEFHYPMLAEKLGWRWFWPADGPEELFDVGGKFVLGKAITWCRARFLVSDDLN